MADFYTNYPAAQKPMTLGEMLNMASGVQNYQQAQQMNPLALQKAQQETRTGQINLGVSEQKDKERKDIMQFMSNPDNWHTNDQIDLKKLQRLTQIAPLTGVEHIGKITELQKHQTDAREASQNLTQKQRAIIAGPLGIMGRSGVTDPNLVKQELDSLAKQNEDNPELLRLIKSQKALLNEMKSGPLLNQSLIRASENLLSPTEAISTFAPKSQLTPSGLVQTTVPSVSGMMPNVSLGRVGGVQPIQEEIATDPFKNPSIISKEPSGKITGTRPVPGAPGGFQSLPAYETPESVAAAKEQLLSIQKAASSVQTSQFNNNKIVELADKALVGAGAEALSKLGGGYAALPYTSDATQNRQILGHQLAIETANLSNSAGLSGTDAARGLAEKMAGTTDWTPDAIKSTARMNRALSTGTDMLNRGVTNAVQKAGNNPLAAREFQQKWTSQEQLVPTLQFIDTMRNANADPQGAKKMLESLGGYGSQGYKDMLKRAGNLNELITKGQ